MCALTLCCCHSHGTQTFQKNKHLVLTVWNLKGDFSRQMHGDKKCHFSGVARVWRKDGGKTYIFVVVVN